MVTGHLGGGEEVGVVTGHLGGRGMGVVTAFDRREWVWSRHLGG